MCLNLSMFNTKAVISFLFILVLNFNFSQESVPNTIVADFNKKSSTEEEDEILNNMINYIGNAFYRIKRNILVN